MLEPLFVSTGVVAMAEMGDKTQLLSLVLASRFLRPIPIILGIFVATIVNHAGAGLAGQLLGSVLHPFWLKWGLAVSFWAIAAWVLVPDRCDEDACPSKRYGAFITSLISFFLAEMGDKTQVATIALAMRYNELSLVVLGTTIGMLIANVPVVFLGNAMASRLPLKAIRFVAAGIFFVMGVMVALGLHE
ncbi:MAG: TMEM165/GDT1 family protein [Dissulfuribacterales bacterium]